MTHRRQVNGWTTTVFLCIVLCLGYFIIQAWTWLPRDRPADFTVRYHLNATMAHETEDFVLSSTTCQSVTTYREQERSVLCTFSETEIDALYAILRTNRVDRLYGLTIPYPVLCHAEGSESITVTVQGQTYTLYGRPCAWRIL